MSTNILINATQSEEVRVAITENGQLFDFDIESTHREQKKSNIYKGKISRVEPSLNAVFVDYGAERHGFLPLKEIAPEYFNKKPERGQKLDLKASIKEGQDIIVQINKEERGSKGAALSSYITLAGCYLVLMPNNERAGGISRRIEGEERTQLKDALNSLDIPEGMGVIVRTNGLGRTQEELQWDLDALIKLWKAINEASTANDKTNFLIYRESDVISRTIRDYLREDINQIIVDTQEAHDRVMTHVNRLRPEFANKVKIFKGNKPLFITHHIEHQIETAYQREVTLPSGGVLVIDHTEALTSIDINSSRATKGEDIEETALHTNLEAAMEIARQSRLRDLGGLLVIDFIDMLSSRHQRDVESQLYESFKRDRARVQIGRISRFGLLEMSRQRVRPSLGESSHITCPRCEGQGTIRGVESLGLSIVRLIEEDAASGHFAQFTVELPVVVATFLLNEKRDALNAIEQQRNVRIALLPNQHMQTPSYEIKRFKGNGELVSEKSYRMLPKGDIEAPTFLNKGPHEEAVIKGVAIDQPPKRPSVVAKFIKGLFKSDEPTKESASRKSGSSNSQRRRNGSGRNNSHQRRGEGNKNNRNRQQSRNNDNRRDQKRDNRSKQRDNDQNDKQQDNRQERRQDNKRQDRNQGRRNDRGQRNNRRDQRRDQRQEQPVAAKPVEQTQQAPTPKPAPQAAPVEATKQATPQAQAPAKPAAPRVSDQVKQVLASSKSLGSENAQQTESKRPENYVSQRAMKVDVQEQRTEFSIEKVRERMSQQQSSAQQVGAATAAATPKKMDVDTQSV